MIFSVRRPQFVARGRPLCGLIRRLTCSKSMSYTTLTTGTTVTNLYIDLPSPQKKISAMFSEGRGMSAHRLIVSTSSMVDVS